MNKFPARTLALAVLVAPLLFGCSAYRNWVDPCYPQRYSHTARKEVIDAFAPQVQNGHVLDQTIWNYMFNTGTDEINGYGRYKLDYMVRRRPAPDPNVFIQTAHDLTYDPADPDKIADFRRELDLKRVTAIQKYLNAQTVGRPMQFEYAVHDPYPVSSPSATASGNTRLAHAPTSTGVLGTTSSSGGFATGQVSSGQPGPNTPAAQGGGQNQGQVQGQGQGQGQDGNQQPRY